MENGIAKRLVSPIADSAVSRGLRSAGIVVAGSALVAICSHIAVPLWFTPVPLTLQPFAVLLLGLLLAPRLAATTLGLYLLEGAAGLPVFAPGVAFGTGIAHLLGPTGGYLMAYPGAAALVAYLWRHSRHGYGFAMMSAAAGNVTILLCGWMWLMVLAHGGGASSSMKSAFALAVLPFLPGDALKVVVAAAIAKGFDRARRVF